MATVSISGGVAPYLFFVDGNPVLSSLLPLGPGAHLFLVSDANGCTADSTLLLNSPSMPYISLPGDTAIQLGQALNIEAITNLDVWQSLVWQPVPDSNCASCLIQSWIPLESGLYQVTITDTLGCIAKASIRVAVKKEGDVYIPNVFSPDGDGENDVFRLSAGLSVADLLEIAIFDRWGEMVYWWDTPVPANEWPGWNGFANSQKAELGVYVYYFKIRRIDGEIVTRKGDVTIIKR